MKALNVRNRKEVVIAMRKALNNLKAAKADLDCARGWGIFDIAGGGIFVSMIKQAKMEEAMEHLQSSMRYLQKYRRDNDFTDYVHQDFLRLGEFATYTDSILDNPITDIYVRTRINGLRERIGEAIVNMESLLEEAGLTDVIGCGIL